MKVEIVKIKLKLKDREITLTADEAKAVHRELETLLGKTRPEVVKEYVPYAVPSSPIVIERPVPWTTPWNPWKHWEVTCCGTSGEVGMLSMSLNES